MLIFLSSNSKAPIFSTLIKCWEATRSEFLLLFFRNLHINMKNVRSLSLSFHFQLADSIKYLSSDRVHAVHSNWVNEMKSCGRFSLRIILKLLRINVPTDCVCHFVWIKPIIFDEWHGQSEKFHIDYYGEYVIWNSKRIIMRITILL